MEVLKFIQIDDESVLRSLSSAIRSARYLRELTLWADPDSNLSLDSLFGDWEDRAEFEPRVVELRGFAHLGKSSDSLWQKMTPSKVREMTLEIIPRLGPAERSRFWESSTKAGLRPTRLSTNLAAPGLTEFVSSFSGLEIFDILPSDCPHPVEPLAPLIECLHDRHSPTLKVLAISPQDQHESYAFNLSIATWVSERFPKIEELRFEVPGLDTVRYLCNTVPCRLILISFLLRI
jgi:hypothetical protein